jgi:hypothetical protein
MSSALSVEAVTPLSCKQSWQVKPKAPFASHLSTRYSYFAGFFARKETQCNFAN